MTATARPGALARRFLRARDQVAGDWSSVAPDARRAESFYRERWKHDRVVRTTHGVNCTGSCSWKVHVKNGIVAWETQQTDYPSNGPDTPEYEPRGCPRGASFSWYIYSPLRVRYPYIRGTLLDLYREARDRLGDPVDAWAEIVADEEKARSYKSQRGKGGFVRVGWDEAAELVAAAHVYTVDEFGPDRVFGFSPIPAMSATSFSAGSRFLSLIGGTMLSFYDWYCDLPPASPQMWGDQTDVPESADWWNASYVILWGSNIPQTRTPDAHFMTEARYRGQKVVVVSPDFAGHTKFADHWLPAHPGTDGALATSMARTILKEFYVDRQVPYFESYARRFTDLPFLVRLRERDDGHVSDRFLRASDLGDVGENSEWKTVLLDEVTGDAVVPDGSIGFRWGEEGQGHWNLDLGEVTPRLSLLGVEDEQVEVVLPRFDVGDQEGGETVRRGVPAKRINGELVTTVFDLFAAQLGVQRGSLPGVWPRDDDDASQPCTPAWQEGQTGVDAGLARRVAREFARNAERSGGRSMIMMGAGTNHWYHGDQIYRGMLAMLVLCGCQGVNGGGWAHYVGQEKVRPFTGFAAMAFALDWTRPPRQQASMPFWLMASDQWRYQVSQAGEFTSPTGPGRIDDRHVADCYALSARLGWMPSYPSLNRNPLEIADEAARAGRDVPEHVVAELTEGRLRFAAEDPDAPENFPRTLLLWRANLIGSSTKGQEYWIKHVLGVENNAIRNVEPPPEHRPEEIVWHEDAPIGKLDLFTTIDFRMCGSAIYSDVVLPTATWYEKSDISSTDMHPFVHPLNAAIEPPWEARSDFEIFKKIARHFQDLAGDRLGTRTDVVVAPLLHDTPEELAQPLGEVKDWKAGECEPVPGRTMPKIIPVERDFGAVYDKFIALGPLVKKLGLATKGVKFDPAQEVDELAALNGVIEGGVGDGCPSLETDVRMCDAILALSATTNGRLAVEGFRDLEKRAGVPLADVATDREEDRITFQSIQAQPQKVIASPEWAGMEGRERRYSPFTINVERLLPWRTLTGRQQFYVDHEWMLEFGEGLPAYRPPVDVLGRLGDQGLGDASRKEVHLRWLTPHSKWSIHSEFQDNLTMLTLFRGGPVVWMSDEDAEHIGVVDNDWIEVYNRNGVIACRAVVSHRVPTGTALMYHSQDRHINVPRSEVSGTRGGSDNAVTRLSLKPTHLIGGYAQLSFGFNYYGPTGHQRDEVVAVSKRQTPVEY
ncbi:MAG: nitrate reductase subunit alpha [Miltoncostaeaceae bacterium]